MAFNAIPLAQLPESIPSVGGSGGWEKSWPMMTLALLPHSWLPVRNAVQTAAVGVGKIRQTTGDDVADLLRQLPVWDGPATSARLFGSPCFQLVGRNASAKESIQNIIPLSQMQTSKCIYVDRVDEMTTKQPPHKRRAISSSLPTPPTTSEKTLRIAWYLGYRERGAQWRTSLTVGSTSLTDIKSDGNIGS
jgi:hypothetical protein